MVLNAFLNDLNTIGNLSYNGGSNGKMQFTIASRVSHVENDNAIINIIITTIIDPVRLMNAFAIIAVNSCVVCDLKYLTDLNLAKLNVFLVYLYFCCGCFYL